MDTKEQLIQAIQNKGTLFEKAWDYYATMFLANGSFPWSKPTKDRAIAVTCGLN